MDQPNINQQDIHQRFKQAREARGYSLDDVAETSGLTVEEVRAIESGETTDPALVSRAAAAVALDH